jgi:hypothetical protein
LGLFLAFIVFFMILQLKEAINRELKEYLSEVWTYLDWSIIITPPSL